MTTSKIAWYLLGTLRKVWVRVVAFAVLAVLTVIVAQWVALYVPATWDLGLGVEAVGDLLSILASSMLAVTTFSLAIATQAFAAAAQTATPRAAALLQEDPTAQNVLATFLGAFLFGLVGMVALQAGYYSDAGLLMVFAVTVLIIAAVVVALLRWISHLMVFGRMSDTLARVEAAAKTALDRRMAVPYLGGRPSHTPVPDSCVPLRAAATGHVQHIDVGALQDVAEAAKVKLWLGPLPGSFVHPGRALVYSDRPLDAAAQADLRTAFSIGPERDFEQDPGFGLLVLSEIALRALSPAVNDPGTAIDVLGRLGRVLADWREAAQPEIRFSRIFVPPVNTTRMIEDAIRPIARDGAAQVEVQIRIQNLAHALRAQSVPTFGAVAAAVAKDALDRARAALSPADFDRLLDRSGAGDAQAGGAG